MKVGICFVFLFLLVALNEAVLHYRLVRSPQFSSSSASASSQSYGGGGRGGGFSGSSASADSGGYGGGRGGSSSGASANAESGSYNNFGAFLNAPVGNPGRLGRSGLGRGAVSYGL